MIYELISAFIILIVTFVFYGFSNLSMPMTITSTLIVLLVLAFLTFSAFIWKEIPRDERESYLSLKAGRFSYLIGVGFLVFGIVLQTLNHEIDKWLVITLCSMVFTKTLFIIYSRYK